LNGRHTLDLFLNGASVEATDEVQEFTFAEGKVRVYLVNFREYREGRRRRCSDEATGLDVDAADVTICGRGDGRVPQIYLRRSHHRLCLCNAGEGGLMGGICRA